jgi:hypothetical protein
MSKVTRWLTLVTEYQGFLELVKVAPTQTTVGDLDEHLVGLDRGESGCCLEYVPGGGAAELDCFDHGQ